VFLSEQYEVLQVTSVRSAVVRSAETLNCFACYSFIALFEVETDTGMEMKTSPVGHWFHSRLVPAGSSENVNHSRPLPSHGLANHSRRSRFISTVGQTVTKFHSRGIPAKMSLSSSKSAQKFTVWLCRVTTVVMKPRSAAGSKPV